jgi:hypothetical protein
MPFVTSIENGDAILCIRDNNVKNGISFAGPKIEDFTPTLLYILGLPVPKDMDGRVLKEVFKDSYLENNPVKYGNPLEKAENEGKEFSKEDSKKIRERLARLGYI